MRPDPDRMLASPAMHTAVEAGAPAASRRATGWAPLLASAAAGIVLLLAVFTSGGAGDPGLVPIGTVALAAVGALVAAILVGRASRPQVGTSGAWLVAAMTLLVAWIGFSMSWSIEADRSWAVFNRGTAYLAVLGLGILLGGLVPRAPTPDARVCGGFRRRRRLGARHDGRARSRAGSRPRAERAPAGAGRILERARPPARDGTPGLALGRRAADVAAARAGARRRCARARPRGDRPPPARAAASSSRRSPWGRGSSSRSPGSRAPSRSCSPASPRCQPRRGGSPARISSTARVYDARSRDGAVLGLLVLLGAAGAAAGAWWLAPRSLTDAERRSWGRRIAVSAAVAGAALVAVAVLFGDLGRRLDEFRNPPAVQVSQGAQRLGSFSSNHRWTWWGEAWRIGETHAVAGTGGGTFELARRPLREDTQAPLAPHDLPLQAFAETGGVGLALLLAAAAAAVAAVVAALGARRARTVPSAPRSPPGLRRLRRPLPHRHGAGVRRGHRPVPARARRARLPRDAERRGAPGRRGSARRPSSSPRSR